MGFGISSEQIVGRNDWSKSTQTNDANVRFLSRVVAVAVSRNVPPKKMLFRQPGEAAQIEKFSSQ